MRAALFTTFLLLLGATEAWAEESVLLDEWTAQFEAGVKTAWAHERITESRDDGGKRRFVRVSRGWVPVGQETIVSETRVVTDARGRILTYRHKKRGPVGAYDVAVTGLTYTLAIRDSLRAEGGLEKNAYDVGVILMLIRRGVFPPGAKRLTALDLPGEGIEEQSFSMNRGGDGRWIYSRGHLRVVRDAEGHLLEASDAAAPRWSRHRTTAEKAPDRSLVDAATVAKAADRVEGRTVAVKALDAPWMLRSQKERNATMTGLEHPLQVLVAVVEFDLPMGESEIERLALAADVREKLNETRRLPALGAPSPGTFAGRPSVDFPVRGEIRMESVRGRAHLVRSRTGQAVLVVGFHAEDLAERGASLLARGMQQVQLDGVPPRGVKWRRIKPSSGGLTLEIPGDWLRAGMANRWISPQKRSQVRVNEGRLPADVDMRAAQRLWAEKIGKSPQFKDVRLRSTEEIDVDGVRMSKAVVTGVLPRKDKSDLAVTTVSVGHKRDDSTYLEIVALALDGDWQAAEIDRVIGSVRWDARK